MFCSVGIPIWEHTLLNDKGLTKLPCFICIKSKVNFGELGALELPIWTRPSVYLENGPVSGRSGWSCKTFGQMCCLLFLLLVTMISVAARDWFELMGDLKSLLIGLE